MPAVSFEVLLESQASMSILRTIPENSSRKGPRAELFCNVGAHWGVALSEPTVQTRCYGYSSWYAVVQTFLMHSLRKWTRALDARHGNGTKDVLTHQVDRRLLGVIKNKCCISRRYHITFV